MKVDGAIFLVLGIILILSSFFIGDYLHGSREVKWIWGLYLLIPGWSFIIMSYAAFLANKNAKEKQK
jgi:hypothetical protein